MKRTTRSYHVNVEDYPGFIGTERQGSRDNGVILSVLCRQGDSYTLHRMLDGSEERGMIGARYNQLKSNHVHPA